MPGVKHVLSHAGGTAIQGGIAVDDRGRLAVRHSHCTKGADTALVLAAQEGDQLASCELVRRYRALIRCKARLYFFAGADREDVIQEGLIGLFKAIRDYDPTREASFHSFAELCVTRQIITAVKAATRRKHAPLNGYISLSGPVSPDEEGERLLSDIIAAREICDPAEIVLGAWESDFIRGGVVDSLSEFEHDVLKLYTGGMSYVQIAEKLERHTKAVDNALQRIKRKMEVQIRRCHAC